MKNIYLEPPDPASQTLIQWKCFYQNLAIIDVVGGQWAKRLLSTVGDYNLTKLWNDTECNNSLLLYRILGANGFCGYNGLIDCEIHIRKLAPRTVEIHLVLVSTTACRHSLKNDLISLGTSIELSFSFQWHFTCHISKSFHYTTLLPNTNTYH